MIGFHLRGTKTRAVFGVACVALLVAGCLGRSPDVRLFSMGTQSRLEKATRAPGVAVLIGPVRLPSELDRPQIVRRAAGGEIELDEFNRWVGGFETSFTRALADDVRRQLGSVRVVGFPSKAPFAMDYQARIHVDDFILDDAGDLRVRVRWALIAGNEGAGAELLEFAGDYPVRGGSPEALVAAHDRALAELAQRISDSIVESLAENAQDSESSEKAEGAADPE